MNLVLSLLSWERRVIAANGGREARFLGAEQSSTPGRPRPGLGRARGAIRSRYPLNSAPGGGAKLRDAGARANHAADGASESGDGSDKRKDAHGCFWLRVALSRSSF